MRSRVTSKLADPFSAVDAAWLAAFRILFGATMAVSIARFIAYGWVDRLWLAPSFHFKYWGFFWVRPLPDDAMHGLFWVLLCLALAVTLGVWHHACASMLTLGLMYIQLLDASTYLNHYYLAALLSLLLAMCPAARVWSLSALFARRRGRAGPAAVPVLCLWLLRFQVGTVYVGAGLAKLQPDWLLHAQPLRIWLSQHAGLPVFGPLLQLPFTALLMSWAGFIFDTTVVLFLSFPRTRPWAFATLLVFHAVTGMLFPIGMFPVIMTGAALVFLPPDWPRVLLRRLPGFGLNRPARVPDPPALSTAAPARVFRRSLATVLALGYCAIQVMLPLRHLAYADNVLWHEQGMRFSWRVMVRAKGGHTEFEVERKDTGQRFFISPRDYLTPMQEMEMVGQPDLILQLAQHIRRDMEKRGIGQVAVRAHASASLNGRRSVPFIDPDVDLGRTHDGLTRARWVLPAPASPPSQTRAVP